MLPIPPNMPPALAAVFSNLYARGRQDFVKATVDALKEPALKDVVFTAEQMGNMLQATSEKCDTMPPAKALTN